MLLCLSSVLNNLCVSKLIVHFLSVGPTSSLDQCVVSEAGIFFSAVKFGVCFNIQMTRYYSNLYPNIQSTAGQSVSFTSNLPFCQSVSFTFYILKQVRLR